MRLWKPASVCRWAVVGQMMLITASNVEAVNALLLPDFSAQEIIATPQFFLDKFNQAQP